MPAPLLSKAEVVGRLMTVIRHRGYDGASLAELSAATGLGKSSLYHYFPEGKDDMVRAVLDHLGVSLQTNLFDPLRGDGTPEKRIAAMIKTTDAFYRHGHESCVLAQLVLGSTRSRFGSQLKAIFTEWTAAIAAVLTDAGIPRSAARDRAEDAVLRIEGALVLAGGLGDAAVFERTLKHLPGALLAPAPKAKR
jgi:TetR/AcrR family transcriptional repressor of lmrAB and yxaGH operons